MDDLSSQVSEESRRKLPPISPRTKPAGTSGGDDRPVRKKRKKKLAEEAGSTEAETKTTPRRRRRALSGTTSVDEKDTVEGGPGATKRKKKRPVTEEDTGEQGPDDTPRSVKTRKTPRAKQNVSGSKTSLLSKDEGETTSTPRTRVKKRKKKKATAQKPEDEDEYTDSGLAADLTSIEDDVIPLDQTLEDNEVQHPHSTSVVMLKSQPTSKIFIETGRGFKGESKTKMARKMAEEEKPAMSVEHPSSTTIEFALKTHNIFKTFLLFCHGVTAGIALWHIVIVYSLSYFPLADFLAHYQSLALPVQSMFYILLVLCTISAFDRHDIGNLNRKFVVEAFTLQSGAVSMVLYFLALVFSVAIAAEADRINLYYDYPDLWSDAQVSEQQFLVWKALSTVRCVLVILGWLVISLTPNTDRLTDNLKRSDDLLGNAVEMLSTSNA